MCVHMCGSTYGGQKSWLSVFLNYSQHYFLRQGFTEPLNLELKDAARMVGQQAPGTSLLVSAFPALGLEEHTTAPNPSVPNTILSSSLLPTGVV